MIVLDEQLLGRHLEWEIAKWYGGKILFITDLRLNTLIKDDAIPGLLRQYSQPTFVTINEKDFWRKVPVDNHYCVVCFTLPDSRISNFTDAKRSFPPIGVFDKNESHGYVAESLSDDQRQEFENHLVFCHKCQGDLDYLRWATQQLKSHWTPIDEGALTPLPLTSLVDGNLQDLLYDYHEAPLMDQLAASQTTTGALNFPFAVEFANGQVVGQFLKRAGHLFFQVKKSPADCTLVYTSSSTTKTFVFQEGEEKSLGSFEEFVATNTIKGMVMAMKRFQLFIKRKER